MESAARFAKSLRNSQFKSMAVLASGTVAAQLVTVVFAPALTRLYGPEPYGNLSMFLSVATTLSSVATLSYATAIAVERRQIAAFWLACLSMIVAVGVSVIILIVSLLTPADVLHAAGLATLAGVLWLLPISIFVTACIQVLENWHLRHGNFSRLATGAVTNATAAGLGRSAAGLFRPTAESLISMGIIAQVFHVTFLAMTARSLFSTLRIATRRSRRRVLRSIGTVADRHRNFPLYRAPQVLLNLLSRAAPVMVLGSLFGPATAGLYSVAQLLVYLPYNLLAQPIGQVLLQRFAESVRQDRPVAESMFRHTGLLALLGVIPLGIIALFAPQLSTIAFGAEWQGSGIFAQWLALWVYFNFLNVPSVQAMVVHGAQDLILRWELVTTTLKVGVLLGVGVSSASPVATVAAYSVVGAVAYVVLIALGAMQVRRNEDRRSR